MKDKHVRFLLAVVCLGLTSAATATTTWFVNGVSGSNGNNCASTTTACKTIGHAISLAASGDTIKVAAATYTENLTIFISLNLIGSDARTTILDGGGVFTVIGISRTVNVSLSGFTVRNGKASIGGGINNDGNLTINNSTIRRNTATSPKPFLGHGGGIFNGGTLRINNSTISGNSANHQGGGIASFNSKLTVNNSTITGNKSGVGGGIWASRTVAISSSTISRNSAASAAGGVSGGFSLSYPVTIQNSIVAGNSGGDCSGTMTSHGYNLSSDGTCNFNGPGDLNGTDPLLGPLGNNGGPTPTMALPSGSPAVDAGNPSGCKDGAGHLLKTDQRGKPRPDPEDTGGCDMGAYESQSD